MPLDHHYGVLIGTLRPLRIAGPAWLRRLLARLVPRLRCSPARWTAGSNLDAATAMEAVLVIGRRMLVFGEPFRTGLGVHNVHQNQGDPPGRTWQDGAVAVLRSDGRYDLFLSRFSSQADRTDDDGHPA